MFGIIKELEIAGSHCLNLSYDSKCNNIHGHNWKVKIFCKAKTLNKQDMVVDFTMIKKEIHDTLDHKHLNDVLMGMRPTAENIAYWICEQLHQYGCYRVEVVESDGNTAWFEVDK